MSLVAKWWIFPILFYKEDLSLTHSLLSLLKNTSLNVLIPFFFFLVNVLEAFMIIFLVLNLS